MSQNGFLEHGLRLVELGYRILPIPSGRKGPILDDWQSLDAQSEHVRKWAANGYANGNVGILTRYTPAIDLDITDESMSKAMEDWCVANLGAAPVRIGKAPKRLLVFTTLRPFRKLALTAVDPFGDKHKVEVLGDGQQFVAYGIHPDTRQPYSWVRNGEVADIAADFLPELTVEKAQATLEAFARLCRERDWEVKVSGASKAVVATASPDSALDTFKPVLEVSEDELREALEYVEDHADYDRWVMVGMALHHQFAGSPDGLALWHEWSAKAHNYSAELVDSKWESFSLAPAGHNAVTCASILKLAHDAKAKKAQDEFSRALYLVKGCNNETELFSKVAKQASKAVSYDFQFDLLAKAIQERAKEITGAGVRIETIRKMLAPHKAVTDKIERPSWCEGWCYVESLDRFFNTDAKVELTERSFNARYDRHVLTKEDEATGRGNPETSASKLALNLHKVPTVRKLVYLPGFSKLLTVNGERCANLYDETQTPPAELPQTPEEHAALAAVKHHFDVLFPNERERRLVIDFLAYNVQFPSERINWAMVIQGVEGAGKSWMNNLMAAVLGAKNVRPLTVKVLQTDFTGWAEGRKMIFVEEIRLHGQNRFELIDKLKPFITNDTIEVHRKGKDAYEIPNVSNYVMFTNHWDALPINENDRRFFVVSTRFQTKAQIDDFNARFPDHFTTIFDALATYPHVVRGWLNTWKFSEEFQPKKPAPMTDAKTKMRDIVRSDAADALADILEGRHAPDLTEYLLNTSKLVDQAPILSQTPMPQTRALGAMLEQAGFVFVGRLRIGNDPHQVRVYTKHPALFDGKDKAGVKATVDAILAGEPPEFLL